MKVPLLKNNRSDFFQDCNKCPRPSDVFYKVCWDRQKYTIKHPANRQNQHKLKKHITTV